MRILTAVLSAFFLFSGCGPVSEHRPVEISLADEFTAGEPEYSGMAWAGQNLVLLPQFPDRFPGDEGGNLLSVPKKRIEDYLDEYRHGTLILNIKEAGIEDEVLSLVRQRPQIKSYFLLDKICFLVLVL